jgi:hypothetical protein
MVKIAPEHETRVFRARWTAPALVWAGFLSLVAPPSRAGEIRCWIDKGAIVAPAAFGDIAGDFVLDLARARSTLHVTRANSDGLVNDNATGPLTVSGERVGTVTLPIVDLDPETKDFDTTVNGVLGADILRGHVLSLDLRDGGCRFSLTRAAPHGPKGAISVPLSIVYGVPTVPAIASDGLKVRSGVYALGTSRIATVISAAHLSRSASEGAPVRLRAFELGGALHEQVVVEVRPSPSPGLSGTIGLGVLAGARLIIDEAASRLTLVPPRP